MPSQKCHNSLAASGLQPPSSGVSIPTSSCQTSRVLPDSMCVLGGDKVGTIFTTQHVGLSPGTVGCGTHAGEVQRVAQHGVHPAEDVRVAAGGEGRRLDVGGVQPAGVVSLRRRGKNQKQNMETSDEMING